MWSIEEKAFRALGAPDDFVLRLVVLPTYEINALLAETVAPISMLEKHRNVYVVLTLRA